MITPSMRAARLRNDLESMRRLDGRVIAVRAFGDPVTSYELDLRLRTIIGPQPAYRSDHRVRLTLPSGYPDTPPELSMITRPQPFHPNWYQDGRWCPGDWSYHEGLAEFVLRMARTLQFTGEIDNPKSPANSAARDWYLQNLRRGIFPSDRQVLPDPTPGPPSRSGPKFVIGKRPGASSTPGARRFQIK